MDGKAKRWRELKVSERRVICIHITARWKGRICTGVRVNFRRPTTSEARARASRVYESWYLKAHFADL